MSALARYFHACDKKVAGYDLSSSNITIKLEKMGIAIHYEEDVNQIPAYCKTKEDTLIVHTPAVPVDHTEYQYLKANGFVIKKRAEVLGIIFNAKRGIAISGTHGKTSITSMTSYIMYRSALGCSAFLGGIQKNINSNLIINDKSEWIVAEADEFDRSFLHLHPEIALVTWVDADHLDIYASHQDIIQSFEKFLGGVNKSGVIVLKKGIELKFDAGIKSYTYSLGQADSDFYTINLTEHNGRYTYDIRTPDSLIQGITLPYPGLTNVENSVGAAALAYIAGVDPLVISAALSEFKGVERRFDIQYEDDQCLYIDDYAHHPRELDAIIGSVRKLFPGRKITGIFQPHLYTRTRDFAREFAESLSALDELILLDIYPAREKPIPGITSSIIYDNINIKAKKLIAKQELLDVLKKCDIDILLTMGAGDIDRFVPKIRDYLAGK